MNVRYKSRFFWQFSAIRVGEILFLSLVSWFCFSLPVLTQEDIQNYAYWAELCESLTNTKKYDEALTACNSALVFNPKDHLIWQLKGKTLLALKQYSQALTAYNQLLRLEPN